MRTLSSLALAAIFVLAGVSPLQAQSAAGGVQSLFLGQRLCGDTRDICFVPVPLTIYRYLHVIEHSVPTDTDWLVQGGPSCSGPMQDIAGETPVSDTGYFEAVVDLTTTNPPLYQRPACFALRGREHYYVNYYAAYLDDSPTPDAGTVYPGYQTLSGRPDLPDLDVTYIHRSPSYPYDASPNAPAPGQTVTFTAHIFNVGGVSAAPAPYEWILDGHVVGTGTLAGPLAAGGETTESFPWVWNPNPHSLEFRLLPADTEISTVGTSLTIRTDALTLGFWVESSAWQYFLDRQWEYCQALSCVGSVTLADWLERQVSVWNGMLADAAYDYPDRVTVADRVRVDEITIVPDGSLPLHGGLPTNDPDLSDHTVDLEWGLPAAGVEHTYRDANDGKFNVDLDLLHELGHARSLADLYRFDLQLDGTSTIDVLDAAGQPAFDASDPLDASRPLHAFYSDAGALYLYADAEQDIMSCACTQYYSPYDAIVLNRVRGRRGRCGNANPPCNLGDWFGDLPAITRLRVLAGGGRIVPDGTRVRLFFDSGQGYQDHRFSESDSVSLSTVGGDVQLPADPFRTGGDVSRAGHNLLLIEVATPRRDAFCFLEPAALNIADWLGYSDARHPAVLTLDPRRIQWNACNLALPRPRVNDPFATSPATSSAAMSGGHATHSVSVRLVGDSSNPRPMRARLVRALGSGGQVLAQGITGAAGTVRLRVHASPARVVDVTDNDLAIPLTATATPVRVAQRR